MVRIAAQDTTMQAYANMPQSLAVDELVDDGIILETDPVVVASRVSKPPAQDMTSMKNIDLSEQGFLNAWEFGKRQLAERIRQGL